MNRWSSWTTEALEARFAILRRMRGALHSRRGPQYPNIACDMAEIGRELRSRGVRP